MFFCGLRKFSKPNPFKTCYINSETHGSQGKHKAAFLIYDDVYILDVQGFQLTILLAFRTW